MKGGFPTPIDIRQQYEIAAQVIPFNQSDIDRMVAAYTLSYENYKQARYPRTIASTIRANRIYLKGVYARLKLRLLRSFLTEGQKMLLTMAIRERVTFLEDRKIKEKWCDPDGMQEDIDELYYLNAHLLQNDLYQ